MCETRGRTVGTSGRRTGRGKAGSEDTDECKDEVCNGGACNVEVLRFGCGG